MSNFPVNEPEAEYEEVDVLDLLEEMRQEVAHKNKM